MRFTIQGELPSMNEIIDACKRRRGNWSAYSAMKAQQTDRIMAEMMIHHVHPPAVYRPVRIHFRWFNRTMRRDLDNIAAGKKFILDAMVRAALLKNDTQEHVLGFTDTFALDRENPRIEVETEEAK